MVEFAVVGALDEVDVVVDVEVVGERVKDSMPLVGEKFRVSETPGDGVEVDVANEELLLQKHMGSSLLLLGP